MSKQSKAIKALPSSVEHALSRLGRDMAIARKRRRIPQRVMAQRMMINVETLHRMEKGDPAVGIGIVATALWVLGMQDRLAMLIAPETDRIAQSMDLGRLPGAVHEPRPPVLDI